jgi:hypothetical protein
LDLKLIRGNDDSSWTKWAVVHSDRKSCWELPFGQIKSSTAVITAAALIRCSTLAAALKCTFEGSFAGLSMKTLEPVGSSEIIYINGYGTFLAPVVNWKHEGENATPYYAC